MQQSTSVSLVPEPSGFRVGDLLIDIGRQRVMRAEGELPLSQLSFELLLALARAAPNLVSFDQLIERVWPGLIVTQETVSQRVKLVRDALADDPHSPRYIAGVRGRGYRMVATVSVLNTLPATENTPTQAAHAEVLSLEPTLVRHRFARPRLVMALAAALVVTAAFGVAHFWSATQRTAPAGKPAQAVIVQPPKTIAVLPLVDISPGGHNEYLGDGLAQELSSRLARIPGLRVAARTSAFAFKGGHADVRTIAQTLGVRHVLEGSVRREGDHLRVTAQLIDATSGYQVWSQSYDRSWQDLLVIEDDLARSIIGTLQVVLSSDLALRVGQPPTAHLAAFDLYLSGMAKLRQPATAGQLDEAEGMFRDAIAIDPRFAPAYAGLCERYSMGYQGTRDTTLATKAEVVCNEALRRDSSLREVEMGLAHLYLVTGRADQAATILRSVIRKDPTDTDAYIGLADAYEGQQKTAAAEVAYRRAVDAEPGYGVAHTALGNFLFHHGPGNEWRPPVGRERLR
jgi:TolB-like protein/DNA-binding winged helix-turn-helix (wHTH) protein/thioredoxin-like negative regulator of GroEL